MWGSRWVWLAAWACVVAVAGGCDRPSSYGKGARAAFAARPQVLEFGPAAVGSTKTVKLRLANEGRASMRIEGAVSDVPNVEVPAFEPVTLSAGAEHEVEVRFTPQVEGSVQGVVRILTDADDEGNSGSQVSVAGLGVKAWVEVKSQALDYGNVPLDTVEVRELRVRNPTSVDSPLRLEVVGTDADQFSSSATAQGLVLKAGEERTLAVAFKPRRLGLASASVRVAVCAGCEPVVVPLSGTGIASQLEISPLRVDFGRVALGATSEQTVMVRNQGAEPMRYTGARIVADQASVFRVVSAAAPAGNVLKPGEAAEVRVAFTPTALGAVPQGLVEVGVQTVGSTAPGPKVALVGEGGSSCISVQPRAIDFGEVAEGMSATRKVEVINRCREQVLLSEMQLSTQKGGFFSLAQAPASLPIAAGKSAFVGVTFTPRAGAGAGAARLAVTVRNGGTTSTEAVQLVGLGRPFPPCQYTLTPPLLDFGNVPVGAPVSLGVSLRNTGPTS
ncbi:MAG TPA: choice-of-anchor D domain-containing protein, partial [Myxococcaceae bacterium]